MKIPYYIVITNYRCNVHLLLNKSKRYCWFSGCTLVNTKYNVNFYEPFITNLMPPTLDGIQPTLIQFNTNYICEVTIRYILLLQIVDGMLWYN